MAVPYPNLFRLGYGCDPNVSWLPTSLGTSLAAWYKADAGCYTDAAMHLALASNQYVSRASETALQTGDIDFTIAGWVYLDSTPANIMYIASKGLSGSATLEYRLFWDPGAGNFLFDSWAADVGSRDRAQATTFGPAPTGTWCFVVGWRDKTAGKVRIQINNGVVDEAAIAVTPAAGTGPMVIGRDAYSSANPWDGAIGRVGFWKRVLTAGERTSLYNAGAGKFYADLTTAEKVSLVEYWNLCESSSTRVGSHAGLNLTAVNTPTVAAGPGEGLCVDRSPVKRIEDQSGNGIHFTLSDITKQKLWIESGINGRPTIRFDGLSGIYAAAPGLLGFSTFSAWVTCEVASLVGYGNLLAKTSGPSPGPFDWYKTSGVGTLSYLSNGTLDSNSPLVVGTPTVRGLVQAAISCAQYVDGVLDGTAAIGLLADSALTALSLGNREDDYCPFNGDISAALLVSGEPSDADVLNISRYYRTRYGTP